MLKAIRGLMVLKPYPRKGFRFYFQNCAGGGRRQRELMRHILKHCKLGFLLETHLSTAEAAKFDADMLKHGLRSFSVPGAERPASVPEAGLAAVWGAKFEPMLWPLEAIKAPSPISSAHSLAPRFLPLIIPGRFENVVAVAFYGKDAVGYSEHSENFHHILQLSVFLKTIKSPYLIFGDFNGTPSEVLGVCSAVDLPAVLVDDGMYATCTTGAKRRLDFMLAHPSLADRCGAYPYFSNFHGHIGFQVCIFSFKAPQQQDTPYRIRKTRALPNLSKPQANMISTWNMDFFRIWATAIIAKLNCNHESGIIAAPDVLKTIPEHLLVSVDFQNSSKYQITSLAQELAQLLATDTSLKDYPSFLGRGFLPIFTKTSANKYLGPESFNESQTNFWGRLLSTLTFFRLNVLMGFKRVGIRTFFVKAFTKLYPSFQSAIVKTSDSHVCLSHAAKSAIQALLTTPNVVFTNMSNIPSDLVSLDASIEEVKSIFNNHLLRAIRNSQKSFRDALRRSYDEKRPGFAFTIVKQSAAPVLPYEHVQQRSSALSSSSSTIITTDPKKVLEIKTKRQTTKWATPPSYPKSFSPLPNQVAAE